MTESEQSRQRLAEQGQTVIANMRVDAELIAWAKAQGIYMRIDRRSKWGNPFKIPADGDRATVIEKYRQYLFTERADLLAQVDKLRGKVLGCWCYPEACHADILIEALTRHR